MPRFEVRVSTLFQFDAQDKQEARWLVENGEMPRDHELIGARVTDVVRVITNKELNDGTSS